MDDSNHSFMSFFAGAVVGGTVGALTTLLLATKEGQKMQRVAKNKYHKLEKAAEDKAEDVVHSVKHSVKNALPRKTRAKRKVAAPKAE